MTCSGSFSHPFFQFIRFIPTQSTRGIALAGIWGMLTINQAAAADLPLLRITTPGTVITQSCQILIPPGTVLRDTNETGAIQIGASGIEIEFAPGSILRGSPADTRPDEYRGYGIRLNGHLGVTIRGAQTSGFWCGIWATKADGLTLEKVDASDNRRAYLKSTPLAEDGGDWLFGHNNDEHEWLKNYGSALYVEESAGVIVRDSVVRHGQNALCLDRVTGAKIYDNDFSFNSGWGVALWRCSSNVISRNALDFCMRGYSHGVYNRGQDSAGIFVFEQNNRNVFAENSVTHGGDGFFGFAGREALGEVGEHPLEWYRRRGNSDNLVISNDLSYAAAHGIEFVVLDRPNPLGGDVLEGPVLEKTGSFTGYCPVPVRHGLTAGEMARLHATGTGTDLHDDIEIPLFFFGI